MVRGASFIVVVPVGLLDRHLIYQTGALAPLIDSEEDVANVDYDRTLEVGLELNITTHSFPVSVEGQTEYAAILVKGRATGVTACDIVRRDKGYVELTILLVCPTAPITLLDQLKEGGEDVELRRLGVILLEDTTAGGEVVILYSVSRTITLAHTHRRVGVTGHRLGGVLLTTASEVKTVTTINRFVERLQLVREGRIDLPHLIRKQDSGILA